MKEILIVSGLDPSGGAGFLADARVVHHYGMRAVGAISAQTEQTTRGVRAVHSPGAALLSAQLVELLGDVEVAAGKIGLLADEECAVAVSEALEMTDAPMVWDPVLRASVGDMPLFRGDPRRALAHLRWHVAVITPNLDEAGALTGEVVGDAAAMRRAAAAIATENKLACLVKGGHLGGGRALDVLALADGSVVDLEAERVPGGEDVHGTGCALSTAIACLLARGEDVATAVVSAAELVRERLRAPVKVGRGRPSVL